jgi:hypothetical protein
VTEKILYFFLYFLVLGTPCLIPAAIFYARHVGRTPEGQRFPLSLYVIALLVCAFVAFCVATGVGIESACLEPAGNLCGLYGVFITGPLSALVTVTLLAWLMTLFPGQMKRIVPVALVLAAAGSAYHLGYEFFGRRAIKDLDGLLMYRLQSDDVDALQRYAPMMETRLRGLRILRDVCLDSELTNDQATIVRDAKPTISMVPTRTIKFRIVPPSQFNDAITAVAAERAQLAIPDRFETSFAKAQFECH